MNMKAVFLSGAKNVMYGELPKPQPTAGEALIKVGAVGICGSDLHYYNIGRIGSKKITRPFVFGHEISGVIESVGENDYGLVEGMKVGIEPSVPCGICELCVVGKYNLCHDMGFFGSEPLYGGMREYMNVPFQNVFPLPDNVAEEEGVLVETFSVGVHALDLSKIKLADTLVISGAGSIGLSHLQLAKLAGAMDVFVIDPLDYRLELANRMGATATINPNREDPVEKIMELTGGRGVDVGIDTASSADSPSRTMNAIASGGTFVFVGIVPTSFIEWDTETIRQKGLTIEMIRRSRHGYLRALELARRGSIDLKPFITHRFPLDKTKEAFETAANYRDNVVKVVITP